MRPVKKILKEWLEENTGVDERLDVLLRIYGGNKALGQFGEILIRKGVGKLANSKSNSSVRPYVKNEYPLSDITDRIIAAAIEVHRNLGPGFEEVFYQRALELELPDHNLLGQREVEIEVLYKGARLGHKRVDFVIDEVMVEIKAKGALDDVDFVQALSYLRASGNKVGLLINFGGRQVEVKRLAN